MNCGRILLWGICNCKIQPNAHQLFFESLCSSPAKCIAAHVSALLFMAYLSAAGIKVQVLDIAEGAGCKGQVQGFILASFVNLT